MLATSCCMSVYLSSMESCTSAYAMEGGSPGEVIKDQTTWLRVWGDGIGGSIVHRGGGHAVSLLIHVMWLLRVCICGSLPPASFTR